MGSHRYGDKVISEMKTGKSSLNRRKFLGTHLLLGGIGALSAGRFITSCTEGENRKQFEELELPPERAPDGVPLKAGLVGCGHRGTGAVIDFLNSGGDLSVIAAADLFSDKMDQFRKNLKEAKGVSLRDGMCFLGLDAFKRLLETEVDVVLLATPAYFRPEHLKACVEARKHVFIEKPVAVDPVGARSVMASSRQAEGHGLCIVSGTQRRHSFDYMSVRNRVSQGVIGKITGIQTHWLQGGANARLADSRKGEVTLEEMIRNAYQWTWLSGDIIVEPQIHWVDVANWFMDKTPLSAMGLGGQVIPSTGNRYNITTVEFSYEDEVFMNSYSRNNIQAFWKSGIKIRGTEGYTNARNTIWNTGGELVYEYPYKSEEEKKGMVMQVAPNQYLQEQVDLVSAIRLGRQLVEAEETARSNLTCIMGRESAYAGGDEVTWEEMMKSALRLGPEKLEWGPVNMDTGARIPGEK